VDLQTQLQAIIQGNQLGNNQAAQFGLTPSASNPMGSPMANDPNIPRLQQIITECLGLIDALRKNGDDECAATVMECTKKFQVCINNLKADLAEQAASSVSG
jgi:hypothetical protein